MKLTVTLGLDVFRDTPTEILHTILLGAIKYVWHRTHTLMSEEQLQLLALRLHAASVDGLSPYPIRGHYLVQYKNALVGKHFKALVQVGVFQLHGALSDQGLRTL